MEFDFYAKWEPVESIKMGRLLMRKIVKIKSLDSMQVGVDVFPPGHVDEGAEVQRYEIGNLRYIFAKELSEVLVDECHKIANNKGGADFEECDSFVLGNPQVLVRMLSLVLDERISHFSIG